MAAAAPEKNFLGVEVHRPGVGHLLLQAQTIGLDNLRVFCADAVEVLQEKLPSGCLQGMQVFFPDPWHKKRHHKRRLINPEFIRLAADRLAPGGILHCATDWEDYALWMLEVMQDCAALRNLNPQGGFSIRPAHRPATKFEARGRRLGHGVWDLLFERN
jgi:tRNA (guanine-N7-)-methyltransferase